MKYILILCLVFVLHIQAKEKAPKMGCILSQEGEVTFQWADYTNEKYAVQGKSKKVVYTPIKKEGHIFKEILVNSTLQGNYKDKKILAKITHIQSKKRIGRGPRHGTVEMQITLNNITKTLPFVYFYESGDMLIKNMINLKDFDLSSKKQYSEFSFGIHIYSVLCEIK